MMALLATISVVLSTGCERIKRQLDRESSANDGGDPVWRSDSTYLAGNPSVVFRLLDSPNGRIAVPVATIGTSGFRRLRLSPRGWKAFDLNFLHEGHTLSTIAGGRVSGQVSMKRGMWLAGSKLDSLDVRCDNPVPAGVVLGGATASLAVVNATPTLKPVPLLSAGDLAEAIARVPTLIAPSAGIGTSMIGRYKREVYQIPSGVGSAPSILLVFNDPEPVADTLRPIAQRPRHYIVILDKGVYGYRPTYTYATLGNVLSPERMTFVDYVDVDGDGKAELFFGSLRNKKYEVTHVLRFENDSWREAMSDILRCQV